MTPKASHSQSVGQAQAASDKLLLSIGGVVGELHISGALPVFREQLRARYGAFELPPGSQVVRDFVVRLKMTAVPPPPSRAAIARRYAETEAHPLAVEVRGRRIVAARWDFDVRLAGRGRRGGRVTYRGGGRCEMSPFAVDCVLRVIFATLLPRVGGLLIHGCGLRHASVGVVFPGPSGAGKTTLARKAPDADDVLSDEIVAVRRLDDGWRVFGTPFWGDFARGGISTRSWPLRTVAFLTQTREVAMTPITSSDATLRLLGCFMSFAADRASVDLCLDVAIRLCAEVRSVEAGLTRAAPTPAVFRKLAPHLGPEVTRPVPPANARELISEFRALLRKQRSYTFRPRGAAAWLKAGDSLTVEAPAPTTVLSVEDVVVSWVPGAAPDDDTLVCQRVGPHRRVAGEILGRVAVLARDGRRLPLSGRLAKLSSLAAFSSQIGPMVALPVLRMAGR